MFNYKKIYIINLNSKKKKICNIKNITDSETMATNQKITPLSPKEFNAELKQNLKFVNLAFKILTHNGPKEYVSNSLSFSKKEGKVIYNETIARFKNYKKLYTAAYNRKVTGGGKSGPNAVFRRPMVVTEKLIEFFSSANLGLATGKTVPGQNVNIPKLNDPNILTFLAPNSTVLHGITNRAILTSLFSLYALINNLKDLSLYNKERQNFPERQNGQVIGADELMFKYFGTSDGSNPSDFEKMSVESQQKLVGQVDNSGNPAVDGSPKPLTAKINGRPRKYYRDAFIEEVDPVTKKKVKREGLKQDKIWLDYYHVFDPTQFAYGAFQSLIKYNSLNENTLRQIAPNDPRLDLLKQIDKDVASKYQSILLSASKEQKAANNFFFQAMLDALNTNNLFNKGEFSLENYPEYYIRASLDLQYAIVAQALSTYHSPKKSRKQ